MSRREWKWTSHQFDKLNKVIQIIEDLKDYIPLTLRQVYYQMVAQYHIENKQSEYGMLSKLLKYARIDGHIPWDYIEDRVRAFHDLRGYSNRDSFINQELEYFLEGYTRNLLQTQDNHIEIWVEKNALSSVFVRAARQYTVPVVVCRGFSSISFLNDFRDRAGYYSSVGKNVVLLYFGDLDPSGVEMLDSMDTTFKQELMIDNVELIRVALLMEDINKYSLPHDPKALKWTDTRAKKYIKKYGEIAVELDALRPDILEQKVRTAIEENLDMEAYNREIDKEDSEFDKLNKLKDDVNAFILSSM